MMTAGGQGNIAGSHKGPHLIVDIGVVAIQQALRGAQHRGDQRQLTRHLSSALAAMRALAAGRRQQHDVRACSAARTQTEEGYLMHKSLLRSCILRRSNNLAVLDLTSPDA